MMKALILFLTSPKLKTSEKFKLLLLVGGLLFLLAFLPAHAQNKKVIDSLMCVYHQAKHDTTKIRVLFGVMEAYSKKPDTVLIIAQKTLIMSEKINYSKGQGYSLYYIAFSNYTKNNYTVSLEYYKKSISYVEKTPDIVILANILNNIAVIYDLQGYYASCLEYYQKSLAVFKKLQNHYGIAICLANIGNTHKNLGNYPASIEHYLQGLKIFEELKNAKNVAYVFNNMGIVYLDQGNMTLAEDYFMKSLKMREQINDKKGMASCLNNIGNLYLKQSKPKESLEKYKKSLAIYEEVNDIRGQAISLNNIGDIYNQMLMHQEALQCYEKALSLNEKIKNKWGMTYSLLGLARAESAFKNYDKGIEHAKKSLEIAQDIKGLTEMKNAYRNLFILHREKGDYQKALEYHQRFTATKDSIFNEQNTKIIANLEAKVEIERKQKEKDAVEKDLKLQQIEAERERNARLAVEKQAEADHLLALAQQEKDKRKQDSLQNLAQKVQLEADNLKAKEKQLQAESKARQLEIIKEKEVRQFQLYLLYGALAAFLIVAVLAYFIFLAQQKEKKAKELITLQKEEILQQNEEIIQQNEEISQQKDVLALQAQELETANQTKDKLFAIIGHDLRSPISSLEGMLNLLNMGLVNYEEIQGFMPQLHNNVKNMQNTLDNLLQWSITQMQGIKAVPTTINLSELVEEKVGLFTEVAKAKSIALSAQVPAQLTAFADPNHVRLLFRNLINNALKFTPERGSVELIAQQQEFQVIAHVRDTGVGMSKENVDKLFKKNQNFTTYGTSGEKGTGLGLQLCQEIIEKNGGAIWVSSEQGKGSTFSFSLPAKERS